MNLKQAGLVLSHCFSTSVPNCANQESHRHSIPGEVHLYSSLLSEKWWEQNLGTELWGTLGSVKTGYQG